jgi:hypothetical protein
MRLALPGLYQKALAPEGTPHRTLHRNGFTDWTNEPSYTSARSMVAIGGSPQTVERESSAPPPVWTQAVTRNCLLGWGVSLAVVLTLLLGLGTLGASAANFYTNELMRKDLQQLAYDLDPSFGVARSDSASDVNPNVGVTGLYGVQRHWKVLHADRMCADPKPPSESIESYPSVSFRLTNRPGDESFSAHAIEASFRRFVRGLAMYHPELDDRRYDGLCTLAPTECTPTSSDPTHSGAWWTNPRCYVVADATSIPCPLGQFMNGEEMRTGIANVWTRACGRFCNWKFPSSRYMVARANPDLPQCECLSSCGGAADATTPEGYTVYERVS